MASARALKLWVLGIIAFLALVGLSVVVRPLSEFISESTLSGLHSFALVPGLPLAAILLSEMPLRDGIRQRTLLYPLLGPVSRGQLAAVRTLATAGLLALTVGFLVLVTGLFRPGGIGMVGRELAAVALAAPAYIGLFGVVHMLTRRGLIAGLVIYGLFDEPLGRLPFAIRNLSPSYHYRVLLDRLVEIDLPITLGAPDDSVAVSVGVLLVMGIALTAAGAYLFSRRNLGELC